MTVITTAQLQGLDSDIDTIDDVVESSKSTTTSKLGTIVRTLSGLSESIGYDVSLGVFASGKTIEFRNQVLSYDGGLYRPDESLPYTTDGASPDLDSGTWLVVSDGVLSGIARSLNVQTSDVMYSTDTTSPIVKYIYSVSQQVIYSVPNAAIGKTIDSIATDQLTTTEPAVYTLIEVVGSDSELSSIARSLNVLDSQVIYSTDTVTVLDNVLYIYDAISQVTWGVPTLDSTGKTLVSVIGNVLTTTGGTGSNTYTLNPVSTSELDYVTPFDFGAIEGLDATAAIKDANLSGRPVNLLDKSWIISDTIEVTTAMYGSGCRYSTPYGGAPYSSLFGAQLKPVGMADKPVVFVNSTVGNNHVSCHGFGIDMANCDAGTSVGDFDVDSMTIGYMATNTHNIETKGITVINLPSNSAGFVLKSEQPGGGLYWGKHDSFNVFSKQAAGDDPAAKGFVFLGVGDDVTSQVMTNCISYRGWYFSNTNNCQFYSCHAEDNPKDGVYIENSNNLVFIGGFYEKQGEEDAARTYYQFYDAGGNSRIGFMSFTLSGNGINGFPPAEGNFKLNVGGSSAGDRSFQYVGSIKVDDALNTLQLDNTSILGYVSSFNSTVPALTDQSIFFSTVNGYDIKNEYNSGSGNLDFNMGDTASYGPGVGSIRIDIDLFLTSPTAILGTTKIGLHLNGGGYTGVPTIYENGNGSTQMRLKGSFLIRTDGASISFLQFSLENLHSDNVSIINTSGGVSESWFSASRES